MTITSAPERLTTSMLWMGAAPSGATMWSLPEVGLGYIPKAVVLLSASPVAGSSTLIESVFSTWSLEQSLEAVKVTVYSPGSLIVYSGFCVTASTTPSLLKSHGHEVASPVEASVNKMVNGAYPLVTSDEQSAATGTASGGKGYS